LKAWTKEEALKVLEELSSESDRLRASKEFSSEHVQWTAKCYDTLEEVFGPASWYYRTFTRLTWQQRGSFTFNLYDYDLDEQAGIDAKQHEAYLRDLGIAKGLLLSAVDYLNERELPGVYNAKDTGPEASIILRVLRLAEHQLRKVIRTKPEKEKEVQNAFENLLIGADIPYGREVDSIEYSSKTYTSDFSLSKISLAIEVKLCSRSGREKEVIAEINDDILAYQTKYQNLLFVVYDLGFIRDKDRFSRSFEEYENVTIRVVKH